MAAESGRGDRAEGPFDFHSSREERLSLAGAPAAREGGRAGIFRRNRTLLVVLVDILLFLMLGVLLVRFLYAQTPRARLEGYTVTLRGLVYGEVVYATLTVSGERSGGPNEREAGDGRIYARLALARDAPDTDAQFLSAQLPGAELAGPGASGQGGELILRESLAVRAKSAATLYAQVRIGESVRLLSCGLAQ